MSAIEQIKGQPLRQVKSIKDLLWNDQAKGQLQAVSAKHMNPERMMRVVANAIRTTPKLQDCEPMSFLGALMQCAALGLEPNTILGHAYLIPFENKRKNVVEVQLVVGYKGLIDLARRSGHITAISAGIHYSDDELWEYEEGTEARLRHRPGDQNGKKLHAYAIAKFKDGGHAYVVLPWSHVLKIRDASQGYKTAVRFGKKDTPWISHEDAMAMKTAIRSLSKYLPLSVEFMDAMAVDEKRADYRTFAFDPGAGVQVDDGTIEGEVEEAEEVKPAAKAKPAQIERDTAVDPVRQQTKAAPKQEQEKPAVKSDPEPARDEVADLFKGEPEKAAPAAVDFSDNGFARMVLKDAADMGVDQAMDFHADAMADCEGSNPALHAYITAEFQKMGG